MDASLDIWFVLPPLDFSVFMGIIVVACVYYGVKFVLSLVTGG